MGFFSANTEKLLAEGTFDIRKTPLDPDRTVIINVNTTVGFFEKGTFYSPKFAEVVPKIVQTNEYLLHSRHLFIVDKHSPKSEEFRAFPKHSITESEQVILPTVEDCISEYDTVDKNCANAMFSADFLKWFAENRQTVDNYIIIGALVDVDVAQLALSLKSYFNERNSKQDVIVIENACVTFSSQAHNAADFKTFALFDMLLNGIKIMTI